MRLSAIAPTRAPIVSPRFASQGDSSSSISGGTGGADDDDDDKKWLDAYLAPYERDTIENALPLLNQVPIGALRLLVREHGDTPDKGARYCLALATRYQYGQYGAPQNAFMAEQSYRRAANSNSPEGQYYLGIYLLNYKPQPRLSVGKALWGALTNNQQPTNQEIEAYQWVYLATQHVGRRLPSIQNAEYQLDQLNKWFPGRDRATAMAQAQQWLTNWTIKERQRMAKAGKLDTNG